MRLRSWWSSCLLSRFRRRMLCGSFFRKNCPGEIRGFLPLLLGFLKGVLEKVVF
jgi:hypothetical protein